MGKPFLALTGELGNNTATSLENMQPIWQRLVAGNLNCVLAAVSWAQVEPEEGKYEFRSGRRPHSGSQAQSSEAGIPVVRKLEERAFELRSLLGEEGLPAVPAHPHPRGQEHRTAQHVRRRQPRRGRARLSRPDAAHQGSGWPRAYRAHDAGGKRSGRAARFARPLRAWRTRRLPARSPRS
jgi:hypothetical protein